MLRAARYISVLIIAASVFTVAGLYVKNNVAKNHTKTQLKPITASLTGACDYQFTVTSQGVARNYLVHVPSSYDSTKAASIVLNFHGGSGSASGEEFISQMNVTSDNNGFIVVYPEGTTGIAGDPTSGQYWNPGTGTQGPYYSTPRLNAVDDVDFVNKILDDLGTKINIDQNRVFATGLSNGGLLAEHLACQLSGRIAAIAPVAGVLWEDPAQCNPARPVPTLVFQGTADPCLPYNGGPLGCPGPFNPSGGRTFISASQNISIWQTKDGVPTTGSTVYQNGDATCVNYGPGSATSDVQLCTIQDGGHTWPGGKAYIIPGIDPGKISRDINASDYMWQFFQNHPLKYATPTCG